MEYNLFIDDERDPNEVYWVAPVDLYKQGEWIICRQWDDVLIHIKTFGMPKVISFDHDLGDVKSDGYQIAKFLCDLDMNGSNDFRFPDEFEFFVHSQNPVGAKNIRDYMTNYLEQRG